MKLPSCLAFFQRRPLHLLFMMLLPFLLGIVASSQQYDYDNGDYQDYGGGDYYGAEADSGYYAQEEDTLYQDYAKHQQEKAMGGGG
jgi:hypothetical protein